MKEVTAAIIEKNNKILIAKRARGHQLEGMWEFPGGKIEEGETPEQCLRRELVEEFNITTEIGTFYAESLYEYETGAIKLLAYKTKWIDGDFKLTVHSDIKWVDVDELGKFEFAPADISIVERILEL